MARLKLRLNCKFLKFLVAFLDIFERQKRPVKTLFIQLANHHVNPRSELDVTHERVALPPAPFPNIVPLS
jgi:hypothetical protein